MLTEIPNLAILVRQSLVVEHTVNPQYTVPVNCHSTSMYKTDTSLERTPWVASFLFLLLLVDSVIEVCVKRDSTAVEKQTMSANYANSQISACSFCMALAYQPGQVIW